MVFQTGESRFHGAVRVRDSERAQARMGGAAVAVGLRTFAAGREHGGGEDLGLCVHRGLGRLGLIRERLIPERSICEQGDVDILEDLTGSDAQNTVGGLDEIVALASGVQAAENIGEGEAGAELPGFDEEAGAVSDPWTCCFHEYQPVWNCW